MLSRTQTKRRDRPEQGGSVRCRCGGWTVPLVEIFGLIWLLAGFNLSDCHAGIALRAQPALNLSVSAFPNTRQIDRAIWNEHTEQRFIFSAPTLAMVGSKFVAVFDIASDSKLAIDVVQLIPRPEQGWIKDIFNVFGLGRQSKIGFSCTHNFANRSATRYAVAVDMWKLCSSDAGCDGARYGRFDMNSEIESGTLAAIIEIQSYYWFSLNSLIHEAADVSIASAERYMWTLLSFEFSARFRQRLIESSPLHEYRCCGNRSEKQRNADYELVGRAFADEQPSRTLIPAIVFVLAGIGCGIFAVHFGFRNKPLLGIGLYVLMIGLFCAAGMWVNYATLPSVPLAYG
jgi:hypothetical protein